MVTNRVQFRVRLYFEKFPATTGGMHPWVRHCPDRYQNLNNGSVEHAPHQEQISSKTVHNFLRTLADSRETNRQTYKQTELTT